MRSRGSPTSDGSSACMFPWHWYCTSNTFADVSLEKEQFLSEQFRLHSGAVYRRALRLLGNPADAEEVLQDVFVKLSQRAETLDGKEPLLAWLYRLTSNQCIDLIRQRKRRSELLAINYHPEVTYSWVPEDTVTLHKVLESLAPDLAAAAIYAYCDGMPHHEIAEVLGVSKSTVGNLLDRVQKRARKLLSAGSVRTMGGQS